MSLEDQELALKRSVEELIDSGCNYKLDSLEKLYSKELKVVMISPEEGVMTMDFEQVMDLFKSKKKNGDPPLDTSSVFNYIEIDGDLGHVVVTRNVALMGKPQEVVFNLTLSSASGDWKIVREFAVVTGDA